MRLKLWFQMLVLATILSSSCALRMHDERSRSSGPTGAEQQPFVTQPTPSPQPPALQFNQIPESLIPNVRQVNANIVRGGGPSEAGIKSLAAMGIRTVLSLEKVSKSNPRYNEETWVKNAGMQFIRIPMHGLLRPSVSDIKQALGLLTTSANYPIFVHCKHGEDRTGVVVAAYRMKVDGMTYEQAVAEMRSLGHSKFLYWWDSVLKKL